MVESSKCSMWYNVLCVMCYSDLCMFTSVGALPEHDKNTKTRKEELTQEQKMSMLGCTYTCQLHTSTHQEHKTCGVKLYIHTLETQKHHVGHSEIV